MRLDLVFGFLGSGKTTLVQRILAERPGAEKTAVIVNEFGEVGIDGAILEGRDVDMIELTSGCLCCTLKGPLLNAVEELRDRAGVKRIVIEATGVAQPEELIETFADPAIHDRYEIGPIVTVVNAPKYPTLREALGEFFVEQIHNADVVILNKTDLASAADLDAVGNEVARINPRAEILFAERCEVDIRRLFEGRSSGVVDAYLKDRGIERMPAPDSGHGHDHHDGHGGHGDHLHAPAQSFVLDTGGEASLAGVEAFFHGLPANVWRAKGFMSVDGRPVLVQFSVGQLEIAPAEPRALRHMVFIGRDMDRPAIEKGFGALLSRLGEGAAQARARGGRR